jgi:two-component system, response regulator PdtaR
MARMCHVLIIEDDWLIADHIAMLVETAGALSTELAATEDEAVSCALNRRPAVIVSDVTLRAGLGPSAVARIIAEVGNVPVMFVTGEPRAFRPASADIPVLHKPFEDRLLITTFKSIKPVP